MSYEVLSLPEFDKQVKKLVKKYPSLKKELKVFVNNLTGNPAQGVLITENCYKIRLAIKSKGKGKSGGARIITTVLAQKEQVYLLTIYDKSDKENISDSKLNFLLSQIEDIN